MATKHLTVAQTAALIRKALKEAFRDVKFSVRSDSYAGGASIRVRWIDGPNNAQVEAVAKRFKASYFDSSIDYQGSVYHMMDGEQVRFGADYISCNREYSDASVQRAIDHVFRKYAGNFIEAAIGKPSVEMYRSGYLHALQLPGLHVDGRSNIQRDISLAMDKHTDRMKVATSATAAKIFVTHDDGYSRACGEGFSAVPVDKL
jgi:hypothetical protein